MLIFCLQKVWVGDKNHVLNIVSSHLVTAHFRVPFLVSRALLDRMIMELINLKLLDYFSLV